MPNKFTAYLLLMLDTSNLDAKGYPAVVGADIYGEPRPTIMLSMFVWAELARATAPTYEEAKAHVLQQVQHHAWLRPLLKE